MKTIAAQTIWHNAKEELPETSGWYITKASRGTAFCVIHYSAENKAFNLFDECPCNMPIECDWWTEEPELPDLNEV